MKSKEKGGFKRSPFLLNIRAYHSITQICFFFVDITLYEEGEELIKKRRFLMIKQDVSYEMILEDDKMVEYPEESLFLEESNEKEVEII